MRDERELIHADDPQDMTGASPRGQGHEAHFARLSQQVIDASSASTWKEAAHEWRVTGCAEDESFEGVCVCGQQHLRYLYEIWNEGTRRTLFPIGSVCIHRFESPELERETACLWRLMRLANACVRLSHNEVPGIRSGLFSRAVIDRMRDEGAFGRDQRGQGDYELLRGLVGRRRMDPKAERLARRVIERRVSPYLHEFWRRTRVDTFGAATPSTRA